MEQGSNAKNQEATIIQTDIDSKDGQNKCPKCGATDISLNIKTGKLRCSFCRHEFDSIKVSGLQTELDELEGNIVGSGAQNINQETKDIITLKCSSCGAEVVIDTASSSQAKCHWCRHTLSINQQIPNGSIPDVVLPFKLSKEEARQEIENFVRKRKFFAHPNFKKEFTTENIMGVYFPYMVIDINSHATFKGDGEIQTRRYTKGTDENARTYYDADLYHIERDFDLVIDGLSIESSSDKLSKTNNSTNNVINAIMPFDVENCVKFDANYIKGHTSEKRDMNIKDLKCLVEAQAKDIARYKAGTTASNYDRGIAWKQEDMKIIGSQWKAAYLPVWLYSYQQVKGSQKLLHYVAVNARTKETMGSVPIHVPKLALVSLFVEIFGILLFLFIDWDYDFLFLSLGVIYFLLMYLKYRNSHARHYHESETKTEIANLKKIDTLIEHRKGLSNSKMIGANNNVVNGKNFSSDIFDSISSIKEISNLLNDDEKNK